MPGSEGYLGVFAHHAALVTGLSNGKLAVRKLGGEVETFGVSGGFLVMSSNQAALLVESALGVAKA